MFDVAVVGSVNLDLVATTARLPGPGETVSGTSYAEHAGGKGLNQAIAAARSGARVALVAAVGDDAAGSTLRSLAADDGVDVTAVAVLPGEATGRALITVDEHAENSIVVVAGANALLRADTVPRARVVIAQLEVPIDEVITAFRHARGTGARTVLNPAPADALPDELVRLCDIVVPNEHEADLIGGVSALLRAGRVRRRDHTRRRRGRRHRVGRWRRRDLERTGRRGHAGRHHRRGRCILRCARRAARCR